MKAGTTGHIIRDFFCAKPKNPDLKFGKPRQPNFQKTQFSAIKPSSNFSKTHLFRKFSKKITKFWLKSGQFWLIWQNSVQNFRKPSSKNAKTQFSRKVKSVNSEQRAQKKALPKNAEKKSLSTIKLAIAHSSRSLFKPPT